MTEREFRYRISFELDEIAKARSECIVLEETMLLALDREQLSDAQEAARLAAIKARQLHVMLSHISTVIGVEIEAQADNFEAATEVYQEGRVA